MDINEAFPSKYIKASDLQGREPTVTIDRIVIEEVGKDKDKRACIYFRNKEKGVVLNKTNANNIADAYGPNTDAWTGRQVTLFTAWVDFQGKSVEAVRIRPAAAQQQHAPVQQQQPPQQAPNFQQAPAFAPAAFPGDDIPF